MYSFIVIPSYLHIHSVRCGAIITGTMTVTKSAREVRRRGGGEGEVEKKQIVIVVKRTSIVIVITTAIIMNKKKKTRNAQSISIIAL